MINRFPVAELPAIGLGLFASLAVLSILPAQAQPAGAEEPIELDPVVVTGAPTPANQLGSTVTVVTAEEIEKAQRRTVSDVLATVPGLNVVQAGGPGSQTAVFMRGTNANHVKVLVDGIDVGDPGNPNGAFDFGKLLAGDVERIEVLRGPQSGLYGADAIGGVIAITSRKGSGTPKLTALLEGGSFGTFNQRIGLSGSHSIFNYAFGIDHFRATDTPVTPVALLPPGQRAIGNLYDNTVYSARLGADFSDSLSASLIARYSDSKLLFTGDSFTGPNALHSSQTEDLLLTRGEVVWHSLDERYRTVLGVDYLRDRRRSVPSPENMTPPSTSIGERLKFDLRQEIALTDAHKVTFGLERENYRLQTEDLTASSGNSAVFAQIQSNWFENFYLTSNLRYDRNDDFGGRLTWRIAPAYTIAATGTVLRASYGTGFKAPTLSQLYRDYTPFFYANRNLKPEESSGYDLGFEQPLWGDRLRIGSTFYYNRIRNLIDYNETFTTNVNVGRATTYGNESFVSVRVNEQVSLRGDYTFTIARNDVTELSLLRRPKHKASLQVAWSPMEALNLSATLLYVGSWIDGNRSFSVPRLKASGYATVNLAADYKLNERASVFARVDNLFDRRYETPVGFEQPGLGVYAGVRLSAF
ncbi:TonB-dependent receptor plug domain-containing protein [Labrys neptuniae]|uniref:TonB-dependent receptor n=1 Tax=Labrys neptuniae TaxID=376174 RepID=A0ABV3PXL5_9HYPH